MIPKKLQEYIDGLSHIDSRADYYEQLLDYANKLQEVDEQKRVEQNKVPGCVSNVYIIAELTEGKIYFSGSSDALLVKGLVYMLVDALSGLTAKQVNAVPEEVIIKLGLEKTLTPTRMNATYNILKMMKQKALEA